MLDVVSDETGMEVSAVPLLNDIVQHAHQRDCLFLGKAFFFQALDDFEGIKVVIFQLRPGGRERPAL